MWDLPDRAHYYFYNQQHNEVPETYRTKISYTNSRDKFRHP